MNTNNITTKMPSNDTYVTTRLGNIISKYEFNDHVDWYITPRWPNSCMGLVIRYALDGHWTFNDVPYDFYCKTKTWHKFTIKSWQLWIPKKNNE